MSSDATTVGPVATGSRQSRGDSPNAVDVSFVLGTGRCGSTLVHEILAHHPDIAFISNFEDRNTPLWPARANGVIYRRVMRGRTDKGKFRFAPSEAYRLLEREVSPLLSDPFRDLTREDVTPWLSRRLTALFAESARAQSRERVLHKFTGWPRIGFLDEVFPGARFVHVVRDGRAVANSWLQMPWWRGHLGPESWHWGPLPDEDLEAWERSGRSFVVLAGIAWKLLIDAYWKAAASLPADRYLEIRYEDLTEDSRPTLGRVTDFLGLDWNAGFESAVTRYRFDRTRREAFRTDLSPWQVDQLNDLLGARLEAFGYVG
jgi:hypothetical protein